MLQVTPVLLAAAELPPGTIIAFDSATLISLGIQLINVAILTVILSYFLYKPVIKFLNSRTERIRNEIDATRNDRNEALELKEQYEAQLAVIDNEREEVLHQAYRKAMEKSDQMLFDAKREAELVLERLLQEFETEKKSQQDEVKRQIVDLSVLLAGRIVEINTDRMAHDRLFDEAIAEWRES